MQKVATTGNATIIVYDGTPLLATDPWIGDEEPAYFGSWVLSHRIPQNLKDDIAACPYIWFSHGHPDHLNPTSIERFKGKKILLADHVGSRIHRDIAPNGFDVTILPDRKWVTLTDKVKVHCITTRIQDSILLVDVGGRLFINLNDAGARDCLDGGCPRLRCIQQQRTEWFRELMADWTAEEASDFAAHLERFGGALEQSREQLLARRGPAPAPSGEPSTSPSSSSVPSSSASSSSVPSTTYSTEN